MHLQLIYSLAQADIIQNAVNSKREFVTSRKMVKVLENKIKHSHRTTPAIAASFSQIFQINMGVEDVSHTIQLKCGTTVGVAETN